MAINLQKGQRENINAPKFTIGLGWDTNSSSTGSGYDLDASVFVLGDNRKIISGLIWISVMVGIKPMAIPTITKRIG